MATKRQIKKQANKLEAKAKEVTKKVAPVVEETVADVKEVVEAVAEKVEETVEETKEVVKAAKKATATKKEMKTSLFVEYYGKQVSDKDIVASVKKAWTKSGHKIGEIKTMDLYVKPEEDAVYYVINKTAAGKVAF